MRTEINSAAITFYTMTYMVFKLKNKHRTYCLCIKIDNMHLKVDVSR